MAWMIPELIMVRRGYCLFRTAILSEAGKGCASETYCKMGPSTQSEIVHDSFLKNSDVVQKELEIMDANGFDLSNYDLEPSDDEVDVA